MHTFDLITTLYNQIPFLFILPSLQELDQSPYWLVVARRLENLPRSDTILSMAANTIRNVQVLNVRPLYLAYSHGWIQERGRQVLRAVHESEDLRS